LLGIPDLPRALCRGDPGPWFSRDATIAAAPHERGTQHNPDAARNAAV